MSDELKNLKIPERKVHEVVDIFTRMDEELSEIIKGLDMIIELLKNLVGIVPRPPPAVPPPIVVPEEEVEVVPPRKVISELESLELVDTRVITVQPDVYEEVLIRYDVVSIVGQYDILISSSAAQSGFLITSGTYFTVKRSERMDKIYVKSVSTPSNVWIAEFKVQEGK